MATLVDIRPRLRTANFYKSHPNALTVQRRIGYCYAFHLFVGGEGTVKVNDQTLQIQSASLLFIPPKTPHSFHSSSDRLLSCYNIYVDLWNDVDLSEYPIFTWKNDHLQDKYVTPLVPCDEIDHLPNLTSLKSYPFFMDLFIHIIRLCEGTEIPYKIELANGLFGNWLIEYFGITHTRDLSDFRINKVLKLIEKSGGTEDYEAWYQLSGLSKSQFHSLFKKTTGMTPKALILKTKMNIAAAALIESNQSITSISESLGYSTIHYFSNVFKQYFGEPPSIYRSKGKYWLK